MNIFFKKIFYYTIESCLIAAHKKFLIFYTPHGRMRQMLFINRKNYFIYIINKKYN